MIWTTTYLSRPDLSDQTYSRRNHKTASGALTDAVLLSAIQSETTLLIQVIIAIGQAPIAKTVLQGNFDDDATID